MSLTGILLGLINICIVVAVLLIVGLIVWWMIGIICNLAGVGTPPEQIKKIYMVIVALVALYMLVALLLGIPTWKIVQHESPVVGAYIPPVPDIMTTGMR